MSAACICCGRADPCRHHLTGRDGAEAYLDPALWGRLCLSCHPLVHEDWNTAGVPDQLAPVSTFHALELRLRRTAIFLARLAPSVPGPLGQFLAQLAEALVVWAVTLAATRAGEDGTLPPWPTTPGQ